MEKYPFVRMFGGANNGVLMRAIAYRSFKRFHWKAKNCGGGGGNLSDSFSRLIRCLCEEAIIVNVVPTHNYVVYL